MTEKTIFVGPWWLEAKKVFCEATKPAGKDIRVFFDENGVWADMKHLSEDNMWRVWVDGATGRAELFPNDFYGQKEPRRIGINLLGRTLHYEVKNEKGDWLSVNRDNVDRDMLLYIREISRRRFGQEK